MEEQLIEFETAVLAKEKGFKAEVSNFFHDSPMTYRKLITDPTYIAIDYHWIYDIETADKLKDMYQRPSQSLLTRWIREAHGIHISINFTDGEYLFKITRNIIDPTLGEMNINTPYGMFPTYITALEAALQTALKLIV